MFEYKEAEPRCCASIGELYEAVLIQRGHQGGSGGHGHHDTALCTLEVNVWTCFRADDCGLNRILNAVMKVRYNPTVHVQHRVLVIAYARRGFVECSRCCPTHNGVTVEGYSVRKRPSLPHSDWLRNTQALRKHESSGQTEIAAVAISVSRRQVDAFLEVNPHLGVGQRLVPVLSKWNIRDVQCNRLDRVLPS